MKSKSVYPWVGTKARTEIRTLDHNSMDHNSLDHNSINHNSLDYNSMDHNSLYHNSIVSRALGIFMRPTIGNFCDSFRKIFLGYFSYLNIKNASAFPPPPPMPLNWGWWRVFFVFVFDRVFVYSTLILYNKSYFCLSIYTYKYYYLYL